MFESPDAATAWFMTQFQRTPRSPQSNPPQDHAFTHFDLTLERLLVHLDEDALLAPAGHRWYHPDDPARIGLAKPVLDFLRRPPR
jgi:hypothetical protein